jgi:hypothetical protein
MTERSRSVPLIGRGTVADYGMLCEVLCWCNVAPESCPAHAFARSTSDTLFRVGAKLNHGSTGLSWTNGGVEMVKWLDGWTDEQHEFHMPRCR